MKLIKCCDNCVSATYPFYRSKHPRKRWCSKISEFVLLDGLCDYWVSRTFANTPTQLDLIEQKPESIQLTFNFEKRK